MRVFGIRITTFFSMTLALVTRSLDTKPIRDSLASPWIVFEDWYASTNIEEEALARFRGLVEVDAAQLASLLEDSYREFLQDPTGAKSYHWDYKELWKRPVVTFDDGDTFLTSTRWLVERATSGLRHAFIEVGDLDIEEAESVTDGYLQHFGLLFQWHITQVFRRMYGGLWDETSHACDQDYMVEGSPRQSPDVMLAVGDSLYVFEVSARELTLGREYPASLTDSATRCSRRRFSWMPG